MDKKPIGIFDSGLGGLTVLKQIKNTLPNEDIVYLGDTARVPWGTRSKSTIEKFSLQCAYFLAGKGVKCIVVACNTSSSNALGKLKEEIKLPIFDVVHSSIDALRMIKGAKNVGVIGTSATISSHIHKKLLKKKGFKVIFEIACPLFVPLVENGEIKSDITQMISDKYLISKKDSVDALIMACTHFPVIEKSIKKSIGTEVNLIDPAIQLSKSVKAYVSENNLVNVKTEGRIDYYVTDLNATFRKTASVFLSKENLPKIRDAVLD